MPGEETKFLAEVQRKLAPVRALPVLVELASCLIDGELASRDSIRDRAIIDDAQFGGWAKVQPTHFADGGIFDQIYKPTN